MMGNIFDTCLLKETNTSKLEEILGSVALPKSDKQITPCCIAVDLDYDILTNLSTPFAHRVDVTILSPPNTPLERKSHVKHRRVTDKFGFNVRLYPPFSTEPEKLASKYVVPLTTRRSSEYVTANDIYDVGAYGVVKTTLDPDDKTVLKKISPDNPNDTSNISSSFMREVMTLHILSKSQSPYIPQMLDVICSRKICGFTMVRYECTLRYVIGQNILNIRMIRTISYQLFFSIGAIGTLWHYSS